MSKECKLCGEWKQTEKHHIIKRSQCRGMVNAVINIADLCVSCHRKEFGVHGRDGRKADLKLRKQLQEELFDLFTEDYYSENKVRDLLQIKIKDVYILTKVLKGYSKDGTTKYKRKDLVRAMMGGRLIG